MEERRSRRRPGGKRQACGHRHDKAGVCVVDGRGEGRFGLGLALGLGLGLGRRGVCVSVWRSEMGYPPSFAVGERKDLLVCLGRALGGCFDHPEGFASRTETRSRVVFERAAELGADALDDIETGLDVE